MRFILSILFLFPFILNAQSSDEQSRTYSLDRKGGFYKERDIRFTDEVVRGFRFWIKESENLETGVYNVHLVMSTAWWWVERMPYAISIPGGDVEPLLNALDQMLNKYSKTAPSQQYSYIYRVEGIGGEAEFWLQWEDSGWEYHIYANYSDKLRDVQFNEDQFRNFRDVIALANSIINTQSGSNEN